MIRVCPGWVEGSHRPKVLGFKGTEDGTTHGICDYCAYELEKQVKLLELQSAVR